VQTPIRTVSVLPPWTVHDIVRVAQPNHIRRRRIDAAPHRTHQSPGTGLERRMHALRFVGPSLLRRCVRDAIAAAEPSKSPPASAPPPRAPCAPRLAENPRHSTPTAPQLKVGRQPIRLPRH